MAFFFKQWGGVRKAEAGRELDGKTYDEFPVLNSSATPSLENRRNVWQRLEADLAVV